jgi:hypothetical protein
VNGENCIDGMHLIIQTVHVLAMKGNNGTNRHCATILLPKPSHSLLRVSLLEPNQAFRIVGFLGWPPNVNSSWRREQREGRPIWPYHTREFPVVCCSGFTVVTRSFTHLSITFSNQRFSNCNHTATVDIGFEKLTSDRFLWKPGLHDEYSVLLQ